MVPAIALADKLPGLVLLFFQPLRLGRACPPLRVIAAFPRQMGRATISLCSSPEEVPVPRRGMLREEMASGAMLFDVVGVALSGSHARKLRRGAAKCFA